MCSLYAGKLRQHPLSRPSSMTSKCSGEFGYLPRCQPNGLRSGFVAGRSRHLSGNAAFMVVVGAHCLPFRHLYGMWQFGVLPDLLIGGGIVIGVYLYLAWGDGLLR